MSKHISVYDTLFEDMSYRDLMDRSLPIDATGVPIAKTYRILMARFFEELMLFDKVAIKIGPQCFALQILIRELGINNVERLIDDEALQLVLWTPRPTVIVGRMIDGVSTVKNAMGESPISMRRHPDDPEKNLDLALKLFNFHPDRQRIFKRKAEKHFILPNEKLFNDSSRLILDTYTSNRLESFGLKYEKEPEYLNYDERVTLFDMSDEILNAAFITTQNYRSYDQNLVCRLMMKSVENIESALKISENSSEVLKMEGIADLQELYMNGFFGFDKVYDLRNTSDAIHYRRWLNTVTSNDNAKSIGEEYLDAITGKHNFFESTGGKFIKTTAMFGVGIGLGALLGMAPAGSVLAAAALKTASDYGLGLLDTYALDGLLSGWNPRFFIDDIKQKITPDKF